MIFLVNWGDFEVPFAVHLQVVGFPQKFNNTRSVCNSHFRIDSLDSEIPPVSPIQKGPRHHAILGIQILCQALQGEK